MAKTFAGGSFGCPRQPEQRAAFLGALAIHLLAHDRYSEAGVNEAITGWLRSFDAATLLDHSTLRRYLVDAGYLLRDRAGQRYSVDRDALARDFEQPVLLLDAREIVRQARDERAARKQAAGQTSSQLQQANRKDY